jgi:hypothetical protein
MSLDVSVTQTAVSAVSPSLGGGCKQDQEQPLAQAIPDSLLAVLKGWLWRGNGGHESARKLLCEALLGPILETATAPIEYRFIADIEYDGSGIIIKRGIKIPRDLKTPIVEFLQGELKKEKLLNSADKKIFADYCTYTKGKERVMIALKNMNFNDLAPEITVTFPLTPIYFSEEKKEAIRLASSDRDYLLTRDYRKFKGDTEVERAAFTNDKGIFRFLKQELRGDWDIALAAVTYNPSLLYSCSVSLQENREFILAAVCRYGMVLQFASDFLEDRGVVLAAVSQFPRALRFANEALRDDWDIVLAAFSQDKGALGYASQRLQDQRGMFEEAINQQAHVRLQSTAIL